MPKKASNKKNAGTAVLKKPAQPKAAKPKRNRGLTNAELREIAKTHKPPQSWYDEDHTGLY